MFAFGYRAVWGREAKFWVRETQLCLDFAQKIRTRDPDHPGVSTHCVSTRACSVEAVVNWAPEANQNNELPHESSNQKYQAAEGERKRTLSRCTFVFQGWDSQKKLEVCFKVA